jgi:hypothetical protein
MRRLYLVAAALGVILPYWFFVPFVLEHGLNLGLLVDQLFETRIGAFFGMDVAVSILALLVFVFSEGKRRGMKNLWVYFLCNLAVGVSLALPLFLYQREKAPVLRRT